MLNSSNILALIQEDAPCVYDILLEIYFTRTENNQANPTPDQLLDILKEYGDDNHDVHFWSGRYAQMIESENQIDYWKGEYHKLDRLRTPDIDFV